MRSPWPDLSVAEILQLLQAKYEREGRRSAKLLPSQTKSLLAVFGARHPGGISSEELATWAEEQRSTGLQRKTINNKLSYLRSAYRLAHRTTRRHPRSGIPFRILSADEIPEFPLYQRADHRRTGFLTVSELEEICQRMPPSAADCARWLFWSGWRRSEAQGLRWQQVDHHAGVVYLVETKNDHPRALPLYRPLRVILFRRWTHADQGAGWESRHVFPGRQGGPCTALWYHWDRARAKAGLRHLRIHDMRRSLARNLIQAGVPRTVAKEILGHRTDAMFDRYAIVSQDDMTAALQRVDDAIRRSRESPPA